MAPWELGELNKCQESVNYFSKIPLDFVERLYNLVGGILRYVLESPTAVLNENDKELRSSSVNGDKRWSQCPLLHKSNFESATFLVAIYHIH